MINDQQDQHDNANRMLEHAGEHHKQGMDWHQAWGITGLEERIRQWPSGWGNDLEILLFGDFEPPTTELDIQPLGIIIFPEKLKDTVIRSAMCVLKAKVKVEEKSIPGVLDAIRRINILIGAWTLVAWGNSACRWWSWVTHPTGAGVLEPLEHPDMNRTIHRISNLPELVRQKVNAALYWIREPQGLLMEFHRNDLLRIYAAYWNAFECLVEAMNILKPRQPSRNGQKSGDASQLRRDPNYSPVGVDDAYPCLGRADRHALAAIGKSALVVESSSAGDC